MSFCNDLFLSIRGNIRECMTTPLNKKKALIIGGVIIIIILIIIIIAVSVHRSSSGPVTKGSDVIKYHPFVLGGNGVSELVREKWKNKIIGKNLNDILSQGKSTIDDLVKGYVATQIFDIGANDCQKAQYRDALSITLEQIDVMQRIFQSNANFTLVTGSEGIQKAKDNKKIGSILRVDGGYTIDAKLSVIRTFYNLGVRIFAMTGKCDNLWSKTAWPNTDKAVNDSLTDFGKTIVKELVREGMIIDISGAASQTQLDIMEAAKAENAPVLLSHSGSNAIASSPNNVNVDVLKKLKETGGLILLSLDRTQVCGPKDKQPNCTINEVINHLDTLRMTLGDADHIGIGGDFGSDTSTFPTDLDNPSKFTSLFDKLLTPMPNATFKWTEADLKKMAGDNFINLFKKVEKAAAAKVTDKPLEDFIDPAKYPQFTIPKNITTFTCYTDPLKN